jgi:inner membrane transporter RhtA
MAEIVIGSESVRSLTWSSFWSDIRRWIAGPLQWTALAALVPAPLYVLLSILLVQVASATAKTVINPFNMIGLVFLRNVLGAALLCIVVRPRVGTLTRSQWINVFCLGVVLAAFNAEFYLSLNYAPLGIVMTFGFLGALAVSVMGAKRRVEYVWPTLAFSGILLLTILRGTSTIEPFGILCVFGYSVLWALYIIVSARCSRTTPGLTGLCLAMGVAAALTAPFAWPHVGAFVSSRDAITSLLVVVLFATMPFGLEFLSLKRLSPAVFGVLLSTEPVVAALVGMIMLRQFLSPSEWIALAIVSVAAVGASVTTDANRGSDRIL